MKDIEKYIKINRISTTCDFLILRGVIIDEYGLLDIQVDECCVKFRGKTYSQIYEFGHNKVVLRF